MIYFVEGRTSNSAFWVLAVLFWATIAFFKVSIVSLWTSVALIQALDASISSTTFFVSLVTGNFLLKFLFTASYMMRKYLRFLILERSWKKEIEELIWNKNKRSRKRKIRCRNNYLKNSKIIAAKHLENKMRFLLCFVSRKQNHLEKLLSKLRIPMTRIGHSQLLL